MSNTNTGGPAFPHTRYYSKEHPIGFEIGMTLRDYFAAKAINAILNANMVNRFDMKWETIAREAYWCADAMMEARKA